MGDWKIEKGMCRCCHSEGSFQSLSELCVIGGEEGHYTDLLRLTLSISIRPVEGTNLVNTFTICDDCIMRLKDATTFKQQLLQCEARFYEMHSKGVNKVQKIEDEDSDFNNDPDAEVVESTEEELNTGTRKPAKEEPTIDWANITDDMLWDGLTLQITADDIRDHDPNPTDTPLEDDEAEPTNERYVDKSSGVTLKMFSQMYSGLAGGIDHILESVHALTTNQNNILSEIRVLRDNQLSLASQIKQLHQTTQTLCKIQGGMQGELLGIKEELSVCTVAFEKINSGLSQLSVPKVPTGKLPTANDYQLVSPPSSAEDTFEGLTPFPLKEDKLKLTLNKLGFVPSEIDCVIGLLNNRVSQYYAANLQKVFPGIPLSHPGIHEIMNLGVDLDLPAVQTALRIIKNLKNEAATTKPPIATALRIIKNLKNEAATTKPPIASHQTTTPSIPITPILDPTPTGKLVVFKSPINF